MRWLAGIHRRMYESRVLYDRFLWWVAGVATAGLISAAALQWLIAHENWADTAGLSMVALAGLVEFWLVSAKNYQRHRDAVTTQSFTLLAKINDKRWHLYPDPRKDPVGVVRKIAEQRRDRARSTGPQGDLIDGLLEKIRTGTEIEALEAKLEMARIDEEARWWAIMWEDEQESQMLDRALQPLRDGLARFGVEHRNEHRNMERQRRFLDELYARLKADHPVIAPWLNGSCEVLGMDGSELRLGFYHAIHMGKVYEWRGFVEPVASELLARPVKLQVERIERDESL